MQPGNVEFICLQHDCFIIFLFFRLAPVIDGDTKLPDSVFTASSILGSSFLPQFSRLNSRPTETASGSWSPMLNEPTQYLQITLPKAIPLYGVIMQGSPIFDQYVTSFKVSTLKTRSKDSQQRHGNGKGIGRVIN